MKIGIALAQNTFPGERPWSLAETVAYGLRAEELGFDSLWTNDHFFVDVDDRRLPQGSEALTLLSYLAARTERVQLGTLVLCAAFRPVGQLARQATSLAELSDGRFVLMLGAGWHRAEFDAFGIPFDHRVSRFEEYLEALRALLDGGPVDYDGRYVQLRGAEVPGGRVPPVWVGGSGPRMLAAAARLADGWNHAGPWTEFGDALRVIRAGERAAGRPTGSVTPSTEAIVLLVPDEEAVRLWAPHPVPDEVVVGADALGALVAGHESGGSEHLILHLSGGPWSSHGADQLERAADALEPVLRRPS
jgi:FMNH2-dependent dimethyl sulfone monooxygenase